MAARTLSHDSRTAASGSPTMVNPGSPFDRWTSTETQRPTAPFSVADATVATCGRTVAMAKHWTRFVDRLGPALWSSCNQDWMLSWDAQFLLYRRHSTCTTKRRDHL